MAQAASTLTTVEGPPSAPSPAPAGNLGVGERIHALDPCPAPSQSDPPSAGHGAAGTTGQHLPAVTLPCLGQGPAVVMNGGHTVPTVVNLWASWCLPCKLEMPRLREAAGRAGPQALFLGVDVKDDPAAAARFLARTGVRYPQVQDRTGQLLVDLRLPGIPLTYVLMTLRVGAVNGPTRAAVSSQRPTAD